MIRIANISALRKDGYTSHLTSGRQTAGMPVDGAAWACLLENAGEAGVFLQVEAEGKVAVDGPDTDNGAASGAGSHLAGGTAGGQNEHHRGLFGPMCRNFDLHLLRRCHLYLIQ